MQSLPKRLKLPENTAKSRAQEKETSERTGGQLTPRSGAGRIKGDVRVKDILRVEDKITKHRSFSVTLEHIEKLENAVAGTKEIPVMKVALVDGVAEFFIVPGLYFEDVVNALRENGEQT